MAVAPVVAFDGATKARVERMQREMGDGERPDEIPATEVVFLHDPDAEKALVIPSSTARTTTGAVTRS
jgi:hypothetical protein